MSKKPILLVFLGLLMFVLSAKTNAQAPYFVSNPTLTPDGQSIIFSYQSDLWMVPADGGVATRITAMDGTETRPAVSPDGKWLAFSSDQFGNMDVFVMPVSGGEITRLTWHAAGDEVENWAWDSSTVYFTSSRENRFSSWSVSAKGGTPARVFSHYHLTDHNIAVRPDGSYLFNSSWESKNQAHRKRYRGSFAPQIESYNPQTDTYSELTSHNGKNMWPSVDRNNAVYFISDEANGEYNLYRLTSGGSEQLTTFDTSIKHPRVSADGSKVVFTRDYQLWVYDVAQNTSSPVDVTLHNNGTLQTDQDFKIAGNITYFDVSPDKKKLAFVSRGELFVSDADGKFIKQLTTDPMGRVTEVKWLSDNTTLLFSQTWNGYQNWYTTSAADNTPEKRLTSDMQNNRYISLNSDRSQAVYLSGRGELRVMNLSNFESKTVVEDEIWDIFSSAPSFSPDSQHLLFTAFRNFEQNIYIHSLKTGSTIALTDTYVSEVEPFWSPDGKYVYFQTNRTQPSFPYGMQDADIYRIALDHIQPEFRSDRVAQLFATTDATDSDQKKSEPEATVSVTINTDGLRDRWEQIGVSFGSQGSPFVHIDKEKTYVLYRSNHAEGRTAWWKTVFEPFESPKTEMIKGTQSGSGGIVEVDGAHWVLLGGDIHKLNISGSSVDKIDAQFTFQRNLRSEFDQMFEEMWANFEVNFYSDDFHGKDWKAIRDQYREFMPHVRTRADLRELKNDMLGELNTSHIGFSSSGDEEDVYFGTTTLSTGILYRGSEPFVVDRVVRGSPAFTSATKVQSGDRLVAVNGERVDPTMNRESYFAQPSMDAEITLTFSRGNSEFDLKLEPTGFGAIRNLMYDEWMHERQQIVDEQSDKRIAYVHMKNMGLGELDHFLNEMVSEGEARDGIILDLRYNTGGNVHDAVLKFLSQRPYVNWSYRGGALAPQSNFTPATKPIVLLINEPSLSDAEMTAAGFKELGLGTVIGMETYRWIIFTSGRGLVDGSFYRLPSWGVYTFDGGNLEKTGVTPDIVVPLDSHDRIHDRDPQLDRAIEFIKTRLEN
jgi:tricorn protease